MKIRIRSKERCFTLPLPNIIILSSASAAIIAWTMRRGSEYTDDIPDIDISYRDIKRFFKVMKKCRKYMNGEPLVHAYSKDEGTVEVYL